VARDPDDETGARRIVAMTKSNLAALAPALAYRLVPQENGSVQVVWEGATNHTADDLLAQPSSAEERTGTDEAVDWLRAVLRDEKRPAKEVQQTAKDDGISDKCLRLARQRLGIRIEREGFGEGSRSVWSLPPILAMERIEPAYQPNELDERSSIDAQLRPYMPDVPTEAGGATMDAEGKYEPGQNGVLSPLAAPTTVDGATDERTKPPAGDEWGEV
jgi:hypothetical protein